MTFFLVGFLLGLCLDDLRPLPWSPRGLTRNATSSRPPGAFLGWRDWYLGLPEDRELPDPQQGALEWAVRTLDAEETDHARC